MARMPKPAPKCPSAEKPKRGFALFSPERRAEISGRGGKAAQAKGTGHRYTSEEAAAAGRKGGTSVAADKSHMAAIGRKGGIRRAINAGQKVFVKPNEG